MEAGARAEVGECHARPPTTNYAWPRTLADQVCGEYRPIDAPRVVAARPREGNKRITAPQNQLGSLLSNETIS